MPVFDSDHCCGSQHDMQTTEIRRIQPEGLISDPSTEIFVGDKPEACFVGKNCHCSLWWQQPPSHMKRIGVIGHYRAETSDASRVLLDKACSFLRQQGCELVVGPMNGNTWKSYRLVTWSDGSPPFLMEPHNPEQWVDYWQTAGFSPCEEYVSSVSHRLCSEDTRLDSARHRLRDRGITWRSINLDDFSKELERVYELSVIAFKNNVLYSPIDKKSFLQLYLPFVDKIDPNYVLLAEDQESVCCGFLFAMPDLYQRQYQKKIDSLIVKSLAVNPSRQSGGLGAVLVDEVQRRAAANGFTTAVHALMHAANNSANIGKGNRIRRKYTLFSRSLA